MFGRNSNAWQVWNFFLFLPVSRYLDTKGSQRTVLDVDTGARLLNSSINRTIPTQRGSDRDTSRRESTSLDMNRRRTVGRKGQVYGT